jgi:hypothetical protein
MVEREHMMTIAAKRRIIAAVAGLAATLSAACSLIVEHRSQQCQRDAECASFKNAVCDVKQGICVERAGDKCLDPSGCYACEPQNTRQFQTACTDAKCVPYDNGALKSLLTADGGLPPVP